MKIRSILAWSWLFVACSRPEPSVAENPPDPMVELPDDAGPATSGVVDDAGLPHLDPSDGGQRLTWYRDVLPVVQARCQGCHAAGGIGPFALMSSAEAIARHRGIADAVESRRMPPWPADESCHSLQASRRLGDAEIAAIVGWSASGALEGDPADAPALPDGGTGLPWVSSSLDPGVDYTPSSTSGEDDYRCFLLDPQLTLSRDVIGFDIEPGLPSVVHHVVLFEAARTEAQLKDDADPAAGWSCFGSPGTGTPRAIGAWAPGSHATQYPAGTGIRIEAGRVVVMQVHYNLHHGQPAPDRTVARLQYSAQPVPRPAFILGPAILDFSIPPNTVGHTETRSYPVFQNATVWGAFPHMHTRGKKLKVERIDQTGAAACLIDIPRWDFHWQQFYFYDTPANVTLKAGEQLRISCTWDNPTNKILRWGEGTGDEMCIGSLYLTF